MARIGKLELVLLLALASPAQGQPGPVDQGMFRYFQGGGEIGRETFRAEPRRFESTVVIPLLGARLVSLVVRGDDGRLARYEARVLHLTRDSVLREYEAVADGDSLRMMQRTAGREPRRWAKAARPDDALLEQSVAGLVVWAQRAELRETSAALWLAGADSTLTVSLQPGGDSAVLTLGPQRLVLRVAGGRVESLDSPAARLHVERWNGRDSLPPLRGLERPRPDYAAPPGAAWTAVEVRVPVQPAAGDTFTLACTFTRPASAAGRVAALVTATGSGLQDRDENLYPLVPEYRLFRQVAERVAAVGVATLRCDDRGFGESGGRADSATVADYAGDLRARVAYLRMRPDVDPARIGVIGHSEGGMTGPMVAADDPRLAALVVMAGPSQDGLTILRYQTSWTYESNPNLTAVERARVIAAAREQIDSMVARVPYFRYFRDYDPAATARRVRTPTLIVHGALDRQVTAGQADTLGELMRAGGNRDVTVRVFPGLNHLFLPTDGDGNPAEYAALRVTAVPAAVLDTIATWLERRLAPRRGGRR